MAPLTGAAKAAVEDFFAGRRGTRALHPDVREAMAKYFVAKGLTVPELSQYRQWAGERYGHRYCTGLPARWQDVGMLRGAQRLRPALLQ